MYHLQNSLDLLQGQEYLVIKPFIDYNSKVHGVGESWIYLGTNYLPYDSGLTLHVLRDGTEEVYRLQWKEEAQSEIIENFKDYVEPV